MKKRNTKGHGQYQNDGGTGKVSKAERKAATQAWLNGPHEPVVIGPMCFCLQSPFPHDAHRSERAVFDYHRSLHHEVQRKNPARQKRNVRNLLPKTARAHR